MLMSSAASERSNEVVVSRSSGLAWSRELPVLVDWKLRRAVEEVSDERPNPGKRVRRGGWREKFGL